MMHGQPCPARTPRWVASSSAMKVGGSRRMARSVGRRAPYALARGRGYRRPYAERQRTAMRYGPPRPARTSRGVFSSPAMKMGRATANGVTGHEGGPGKADGQRCGPPRRVAPARGRGDRRPYAERQRTAMRYGLPRPARTSRGVFSSPAMKMGRATANGQKNGPPRPAPMRGVLLSPATCRTTADGRRYWPLRPAQKLRGDSFVAIEM